ncbi:cysteine desulfurase [Govanella unica]|uniref:cysteine desulfurase n=1 Tax=Govanella unica TaxID=2975056 RepID=A0A9X3TVX4_9PROT|nr:cysteine desulfurase [Govania unica]MDA5192397.1 cysteine desulfurase [Govania unica]
MNAPLTLRNSYDVERLRADFPVLQQQIHGKPFAFLDSAASAQKPQMVIDAEREVYERDYANIHRGVYYLSQKTTQTFEDAREKIRAFLGAAHAREIIFTRNATEGVNLVAQSYGRTFLKAGDEVVISHMEHHSNIVPWQILRDQIGIVIKVAPIDHDGNFLLEDYAKLLSDKTKFVSITQVSNSLGSITPIAEIIRLAHEVGAKVLVDGCQAVQHMPTDVQALDADFYVLTGHKLYGPTGIGVLYGKTALLDAMPPYQGGGDMIRSVTFEKTEWNDLPHKFEAGTPHITGVIGLGAAIDYVNAIGLDAIAAHEHELFTYGMERIQEIPGLSIIGKARNHASLISFVMDCAHPHDIGTILDHEGVAVRAGHHCAQPVMDFFDVPATARASFGLYSTKAEIDQMIAGLHKVRKIFA